MIRIVKRKNRGDKLETRGMTHLLSNIAKYTKPILFKLPFTTISPLQAYLIYSIRFPIRFDSR